MSSTSSDDWSSKDSARQDQATDQSPLSPQSLYVPEPSENRKQSRRYSNLSLRPGAEYPEEDLQSLSLQTLRQDRPSMSDARQNNVESLEERIRLLENRLNRNGYLQFQESTVDGDWTEKPRLSPDPQWMTWNEYCKPIKQASNILEVLIERPHTTQKLTQKIPTNIERPIANPLKNVKRIRIRSHHIINALEYITGYTVEDVSSLTLHRPFKILLLYQKEIEAYVAHIEHSYSSRINPDNEDECQLSAEDPNSKILPGSKWTIQERLTKNIDIEDDDDDDHQASEKRERFATSEEDQSPVLPRHGHHDLPGSVKSDADNASDKLGDIDNLEDPSLEEEAIVHLRGLLNFMKLDMGPIFQRHRVLRSSNAETVHFDELWHLFMPGDLVAADDEQNPRLYRVCILPPSDRYAKLQTVREVNMPSDGQNPRIAATQRVASIQCFNLDIFHFDYDGQSYGPVESRVTIIAYKGHKSITDLPYYPVRFRKDASTHKKNMAHRGARFLKLCTEETAFREYEGLSAEEPQELIDSQVVIDGNLGYRKHPAKAPKFGLKSFMEPSARVVTEVCDIPGCHSCSEVFKTRLMFNDARIDRRKTFDFIRENRSLLRTVKDSSELTEDHILLLPNHLQGFVLRSRQWYALDIANIRPVHKHTEGFKSLILPDGVADLVEGLVQTHDPNKVVTAGFSAEPRHQVDLVRGKGKGLIILLHGAPGVGKTSTAECVANYTQRPLFPITCGDLGESAKEVETNLKQIFDLAHRWGCVLLLDEADVFLQARDKENMRRNSVVSVFLRVLEYYSGILILTTNKIGFFDEAFTSRIHIALHYPPLSKKSTQQIWKMNLSRLVTSRGSTLIVDARDIKAYAKEHYNTLQKANRATWNGRQIKNAFQTAIAIAEFENRTQNSSEQGGPSPGQKPVVLKRSHFEVVARAAEGFDDYLCRIHGPDADRARRAGERASAAVGGDEGVGGRRPSAFSLLPLAKKAVKRREEEEEEEESDSSDSEEVDAREKKKGKGKKKEKKKKAESEESEESDEEEEEEEEKKRREKEKEKKAKKEAARLKEKAKGKAKKESSEEVSSEE